MTTIMKTIEELERANRILREQLSQATLRNVMRQEEFFRACAEDGRVIRDMLADGLQTELTTSREKLASLRARVTEYLAAKDEHDGDDEYFCEDCQCEDIRAAEAALRAEVAK